MEKIIIFCTLINIGVTAFNMWFTQNQCRDLYQILKSLVQGLGKLDRLQEKEQDALKRVYQLIVQAREYLEAAKNLTGEEEE